MSRDATRDESARIEPNEETLVRLNDLLAEDFETTIGERGNEFEEMYVLADPDPENGVYLVMARSPTGELSYVETFDADNRESPATRTNSGEE